MSRAWFKLDEIQKHYKIFKKNMIVVDLGAAPGSWSKYAKNKIGKNGVVIAYDIKKINPIKGIKYFKENILKNDFIDKITNYIGYNKVDIIMSDLSPNISGISSIDIPKSINLFKSVIKICKNILKFKGICIIKIFQGNNFKYYIKYISLIFKKIKIFKPVSSRIKSKEIYIIAFHFLKFLK
ncbi:MAG: RlmE family RNA methyltransferase [Enterobacteriaceae bacterium PSpicST2]|nr:MAG: RlmE family RNA methyltransferase [Enterobacteriaceae bacterium PSpicST2]WMC19169.1 MAG: RlmE family RNA methyltransferase [Enterobacteriaceae bacterium PSpicST1]